VSDDNDKNKDNGDENGRIKSLEDFLRRHFPSHNEPANNNSPPPATPPAPAPQKPPKIEPHNVPTSPEAVLAAARMELAAYFNYVADPNNPGIKILKNDPHYKILDAVWNDDLGKVMSTMALHKLPDLTRRWYWHFPGKMQDVSFLTPAHLVRSHVMAVMVNKHAGDFKARDSEGRTPLFYIARHVNDPWVILYMVKTLGVDPYDSGRCSNDYNLQTNKGEKYEDPFRRAIRHANGHAVNGFLMLAPGDYDPNRTEGKWLQTPLMLAVQESNEAAMTAAPHGPERQELLRRLWILREMVSEPCVNIDAKDIAGNRAVDYALQPAVRGAYDRGLIERRRNDKGQPRIIRDPQAPKGP
jgi:hypothetical protein